MSKRDVRRIPLEKVLIYMEAGAEALERCFESFHGILLLRLIQALVIDTLNREHHSQVTRFGQKAVSFQKP